MVGDVSEGTRGDELANVGETVGPNEEIGRMGTLVDGNVGTLLTLALWGGPVGTTGS